MNRDNALKLFRGHAEALMGCGGVKMSDLIEQLECIAIRQGTHWASRRSDTKQCEQWEYMGYQLSGLKKQLVDAVYANEPKDV